jgi:hypothetical protein
MRMGVEDFKMVVMKVHVVYMPQDMDQIFGVYEHY